MFLVSGKKKYADLLNFVESSNTQTTLTQSLKKRKGQSSAHKKLERDVEQAAVSPEVVEVIEERAVADLEKRRVQR